MSKYDSKGFVRPPDGIQPMRIGDAMRRLKAGDAVARYGWNGNGMYLTMRPAPNINELPQIIMVNAERKIVSWIPTHEDLFAYDWGVAEDVKKMH